MGRSALHRIDAHRWRILFPLAFALGLAFLLCPKPSPHPRVLLVGLDGADWRVLRPLLDANRLPNLASLLARGTSGPVESIEPLISPPIWTTIATGVKPERHGITWFLTDTEDPAKRVPVTSTLRRVKALWNVLSECGRRVGVIGWWATYPAERVRGFVISDFVGLHGFGNTGRAIDLSLGKTFPPSLYGEAESLLPDPRALPFRLASCFMDITEQEFQGAFRGEGRWASSIALLSEYLATTTSYVDLAERFYPPIRPDVLLVYFELIDATSHLFARFAPPRLPSVSEEGWSRFSRTVEEVCVFQDEVLGRLLRLVGTDCAVFVVSDHGFRWGSRRPQEGDEVSVERAHLWHEKDGILVAAGPHVRRSASLPGARVLDVAPTILRYLGVPVARDLDGTPLLDLFEEDWLQANPARWTDSYESAPALGASTEVGGWEATAHDVAEEQSRRLEALGYLSAGGASAEIRKGRAQLLVREGKWAEACPELEALVRRTPADPQARALLGEAYRRTHRLQLARKEYEAAISLVPEDPALLCALGEIALEEGKVPEAEGWFWVAVDKGGESPQVRINLGHTLHLLDRPQEARTQFEQALALDPNSHAALYDLGVLEERSGNLSAAETYYRRAIAARPRDYNAHMNLGVLLGRRGRVEESIRHLSDARDLAPDNAQVAYNLGTTLLGAGMPRTAAEELERAVGADPDFARGHLNLGHAYVACGELSKASREYTLAARLGNGDPEAHYSSAVVSAMLGDRETARDQLAVAVRLGGIEYLDRAREEPSLANILPGSLAGRDER